ncbi:MAG: hypothetical protein HYT39_00910 [Candidatus Sungbacteria bacterium]|nr:hypothetical protein [Candidatus Sungbacteria bacterium]
MLWKEFLLSVISGVISSIIIGFFLYYKDKNRWGKTRKLFLSKMLGQIHLARYEILKILDIEPADYDKEIANSAEEIHNEIMGLDIVPVQYESLARSFRLIEENIERFRAQALSIPTFTSSDFHSIDDGMKPLREYTFSYYFFKPLDKHRDEREKLEKKLKEKICAIYK